MRMKERCRLCLRVQLESRLTLIFTEGERSERLRSRILDCCPITLLKDDRLPKAICHECRRKVAITYDFREQCRISERTLRSSYKSDSHWNEQFHRCRQKIVVPDRSIETEEQLDRSENRIARKERGVEAEVEVEAEATPAAEQEEGKEEENADGELARQRVVGCFSKFRGKKKEEREVRKNDCERKQDERKETEVKGITTSKIDCSFVEKSKEIDGDAATEKRYLCDICSKTFASKSGLRFHLKSHNGAKPYQCRHCGKGFVVPSYAKRHEIIHGGEKRFVCHVCSAPFASSNGLKYHLRSHTGQADYRCEICAKSFYRRKYLKEHIYTHTGEKPFVCQTCGASYGNSGSLFVHEKRCKIRTMDSEQQQRRRRRR